MKYCSKCGNQLEEGASTCSRCGNVIVPAKKNNSPLGIIALILAVFAGLLFAPEDYALVGFLLEVIAVILAVLVLVMSKRRALKTGMPVAAICIAVLFSGLCFSMGTWSFPRMISSIPSITSNLGTKSKDEMQNDAVTLRSFNQIHMYQSIL